MKSIGKQQTPQKYIFKINSGRLRRVNWNLILPLHEARKNDEIVSLGVSQVLRWIDELNGKSGLDETVDNIRTEIKRLKGQPDSVSNRKAIGKLYAALDQEQFVSDYMCLVIDKEKDMHVACKGFSINGVKYVRLVGTNGGVKNKTIVFVSERLAPELRKRIDNGRSRDMKFVPAKLEAYRALTCSGSIPVSMPSGILVVNDCVTEFIEDVISISDEDSDEPTMELMRGAKIKLVESDGYGLMTPTLAQRWSEELGLDFVTSGVNTRFAWEKGMVFCFDFLEFAEKIAGKSVVLDAWGKEVDITSVELILTTSMLKLWDSYESLEHYLACCRENHYTFGISKHCPRELESERNLNYQFIQSYELTDDQIEELIQPTIDEIKDVLSGDYRKAILFLAGTHLSERNALHTNSLLAKALMVNPAIHDDPFVKSSIYKAIKNRIAEAKVGVVQVRGNYSIVSGDPYSLCQHIFDLEVTGILKAGQIYNKFWVDAGTEKVACFRAPMTCHNNIRKMTVSCDDNADFWYRHMKACTIFNSWDSAAHALNGMDKDGDMVLLTDNHILVDNIRSLPTIMCIQRNSTKIDVTEDALVQANIDSFGDDIGKTTNWITSMFDVQARFKKGSREYETLEYRIKCGQLFQQNAIN